MILSKFQIVNYKSCSNLYIEFEKDNPNILIGINDCGKSTILNALGLLLDEKLKFNFLQDDKVKKDLSNTSISEANHNAVFNNLGIPPLTFSEDCCFVIGEFILEENDINDEISTHLQWVLDKKEVTKIWLCRSFINENKSSTYYILTPRGVDDGTEYYKEKATALAKIAKEKKVDKIENANNSGRFSTLEILRSVMNTLQVQNAWAEYKFDKNIFPQYRYLDWNISMDQLTQFTKDTMQEQIKVELQEARTFANDKRKLAQDKINKELDQFTSNFLKEVPTIEKLKANIYFDVEPRITDFIINKKNINGDIHIESQGEGIKRQIWFSLIKWNALNTINLEHKNKKFIWCFDEPETHLYPSAQRDFYNTIKQTSAANVQTIISTHSTIFVDKTLIKSIHKIDLKEGATNLSKCNSIDDIFESLKIKNSDFLFYDKFIAVEGDTEETLIPHFYKLVNGSSLETDNIQIINLGGKDKIVQNAAILESVLKDFNKLGSSVFYILDNDASFKLSEAQKQRYDPTFVGKQDIEDSISSSVWAELLNNRLEAELRMSVQEIEDLKSKIISDKEDESKNKFYPHLTNTIKKKLIALERDDYHTIDAALPSKGSESGKILNAYIKKSTVLSRNLVDKLIKIKACS